MKVSSANLRGLVTGGAVVGVEGEETRQEERIQP